MFFFTLTHAPIGRVTITITSFALNQCKHSCFKNLRRRMTFMKDPNLLKGSLQQTVGVGSWAVKSRLYYFFIHITFIFHLYTQRQSLPLCYFMEHRQSGGEQQLGVCGVCLIKPNSSHLMWWYNLFKIQQFFWMALLNKWFLKIWITFKETFIPTLLVHDHFVMSCPGPW